MALYATLALRHAVPTVYPDESLYGQLAASVGHGHGLKWRGQPVDLRAGLYVYLISPAWAMAHGTAAYNIAKVVGALAITTTALPVWLLARHLAPPWASLGAAALTLSGTWMVSACGLVTETLALPLATASLAATVAAIREPGRRWAWIALAAALLATAARVQTVVLVPTVAAALAIDVLRAGADWQTRARQHRLPLATIGGLLFVGTLVVVVVGADVIGTGGGYARVLGFRPSVADTLHEAGIQALSLSNMTCTLPLALALGCAVRPAAWRDSVVGPLLVVLGAATVAVCLESGYFNAGFHADYAIQRYVVYPVPLLLLFALVVSLRPGVMDRVAAFVAAVSCLLLLGMPGIGVWDEERAAVAVQKSVMKVLPGAGVGLSAFIWAVAMALLWAGLQWVGHRLRWRDAGSKALAGALAIGLLAGSASAWREELHAADLIRATLPADLEWIDHHSSGPVGIVLDRTDGTDLAPMELFNRHVARIYTTHENLRGAPLTGWVCDWRVDHRGHVEFDPKCPDGRRQLLIEDPQLHVAFANEVRSASDPHVGRLVEVDGPPRALAVITTPCERTRPQVIGRPEVPPTGLDRHTPCVDTLDLRLWNATPVVVRLRFRGARAGDYSATVGLQRHLIPAREATSIDLDLPPGPVRRTIVLDWHERSRSTPSLADVQLITGAGPPRSLL